MGLIPQWFVGSCVTLGSSPRGSRHKGPLSFLVRSDRVGHSGFPKQAEEPYTVPHRVIDCGTAAICSPVWTGVSVRWACDMDIGTKGIETSVNKNNNYSPACVRFDVVPFRLKQVL